MSERDASTPRLTRPARERRAAVLAVLRDGYRRERPRSAVEARLLREIGTPEALIGPVASQETVDAERSELIEFARLRRSAARARGR